MKCNGCNNENALHIHVSYDSKYGKIEVCELCGRLTTKNLPDVSCPNGGYYDEHLGTYINSKQHKADLLKRKGWVECADRKNPTLGYPMPYIKDPIARRKFMQRNFGE